MTTVADNPSPSLLMVEQASKPPAAPSGDYPGIPAGARRQFVSSVDGTLYVEDANGLLVPAGQRPSARYPWVPLSASAWYADSGATPGAWTLDAGLAASYPANGFARITPNDDTSMRKAVALLTGATTFHALARVRLFGGDDACNLYLGFTAAGNMSDLCGIGIASGGQVIGAFDGGVAGVGLTASPAPFGPTWTYLWVDITGGVLTGRVSLDGLTYDLAFSQAVSTVPTTLLWAFIKHNSGQASPGLMWLDFIALGNTTPAGQ